MTTSNRKTRSTTPAEPQDDMAATQVAGPRSRSGTGPVSATEAPAKSTAKAKSNASARRGRSKTDDANLAAKAAEPTLPPVVAPPVVDLPVVEPPAADPPGEDASVADSPAADSSVARSPTASQDTAPAVEPALAEATDFPRVQPIAPPAYEPSPPPVAWRPRHVVFIDVENTSSEASITRVLDELDLDGLGTSTEVIAIGNWRVIGQGLARSLAARGAQLVHSAPALRVRDWSDLWIAVQAGIWLGRARAGDAIDVVSHDRAFDAIGDAACRLGVGFRRITYGEGTSAPQAAGTAQAAKNESGGRRHGGRGGRGRGRGSKPTTDPAPSLAQSGAVGSPPHATGDAADTDARRPAPPDQIQVAIGRLTADDPPAGVTIDRLTAELKAAGFHRPPGSLRLITRLKRMKDIELLANGRIRLVSASPEAELNPADTEQTDASTAAPSSDGEEAEQQAAAPKRRSRRRGGRRRAGRSRQDPTDPQAATTDATATDSAG